MLFGVDAQVIVVVVVVLQTANSLGSLCLLKSLGLHSGFSKSGPRDLSQTNCDNQLLHIPSAVWGRRLGFTLSISGSSSSSSSSPNSDQLGVLLIC